MSGTSRQDWWEEGGEAAEPVTRERSAGGGSWFLALLAAGALGLASAVAIDQGLRLAATGRLPLRGFIADHALDVGLILQGIAIGLAVPLLGGKRGFAGAFAALLCGLACLGLTLFLQAGGLQPPLPGPAGEALVLAGGDRSLLQDFELARLSLYLRSLDSGTLLAGGLGLVAAGLPALMFSGRQDR